MEEADLFTNFTEGVATITVFPVLLLFCIVLLQNTPFTCINVWSDGFH